MKAFTRSLTILTTGIFLSPFPFNLYLVQSLKIDPPLPPNVSPGQSITINWKRELKDPPLPVKWNFQFIQLGQDNQPLGGPIDVDNSRGFSGTVKVSIPQEAKGTIELIAQSISVLSFVGNRQFFQATLQVDPPPPDTSNSTPPSSTPPLPPSTTTSKSTQSAQSSSNSANSDTNSNANTPGVGTQTQESLTTITSISASSATQTSLPNMSTAPAANYPMQSDSNGSGNSNGASNQDHSSDRAGIIAAGVIGSLILLILLAFLYFLWRRSRRAERRRMSMRNWVMAQGSSGLGSRGDAIVHRNPWSLSWTDSRTETSDGYENSASSQRLSSVRASTLVLEHNRYDRDTDLEDGEMTRSDSPSSTRYPSPGISTQEARSINDRVALPALIDRNPQTQAQGVEFRGDNMGVAF